jgi:hypothetical protein
MQDSINMKVSHFSQHGHSFETYYIIMGRPHCAEAGMGAPCNRWKYVRQLLPNLKACKHISEKALQNPVNSGSDSCAQTERWR